MSEEVTNINQEKIVFTEAEAAEILYMKSERALRDYRYKYLTIGVHYARVGRRALYTQEHLRNILNLDAAAA